MVTPPESPLDVLAVAPHPDDAEIGVGGILLRCRREGLRVGVLDLTDGEPTPRGTPETRARETAAATAILDLTWRENLGLPNRSLEATLEARRRLASVFRLTQPRILLAPYWEDAHPDHVAASRLIDDARFWSKLTRSDMPGEPYWPPRIFYYWSIHLRIRPQPKFLFDISGVIEQKMAAVRCYESQFGGDERRETRDESRAECGTRHAEPGGNAECGVRSAELQQTRHSALSSSTPPSAFRTPHAPLDDLRDRNRYWGWSIGAAYAEPLSAREEIGIGSFAAIV
ncbi:MAG: PIG-L family deacetylase [Planctomycetaceae bacterium]